MLMHTELNAVSVRIANKWLKFKSVVVKRGSISYRSASQTMCRNAVVCRKHLLTLSREM